MNRFVSLLFFVAFLAASSVKGFSPSPLGSVSGGEPSMYGRVRVLSFEILTRRWLSLMQSCNAGSNFVISQRPQCVRQPVARSNSRTFLQMGPKAKFGIFSPAVYGAKIVLGELKLNKIRGKAISLHSQAIGEFCTWSGAYHLRTKLIKKAKVNGDILGFLV